MSKTKNLVQTENHPVFQLKGGLYTLTALQILNHTLTDLGQQLDAKIEQAPKFFQNAPIVIDLQKISQLGVSLDFEQLKEILASRQLLPIGIKGGNTDQHRAAIKAGFALLQEGLQEKETTSFSKENIKSEVKPALKISSSETPGSNTKVIREPVRSGTQIYVREGDLIVLGPVSHGAELLADGHIHVYGPLRGRALAGITGDTHAHIFCQSLEAELVSIAGQYKISEDIDQTLWRQAINISLDNGRLDLKAL